MKKHTTTRADGQKVFSPYLNSTGGSPMFNKFMSHYMEKLLKRCYAVNSRDCFIKEILKK